MTIQQHASFDSSAAELNATSKLVKAWESKNAKNAAKAGGISMMALSLAACGGSSTTTTTATTTTTTTTTATDAAKTISLTSAINSGDAFTGGSGNDIFQATHATLGAGDTLVGGAGTDTLNIVNTGAGAYTPANADVSGIENINVVNQSGSTEVTGVTAVTAVAQVVTITAIVPTATTDDVTVTYGTLSQVVGTSGATDSAQAVILAAAINGLAGSTVAVVGSGASDHIITVTAPVAGTALPFIGFSNMTVIGDAPTIAYTTANVEAVTGVTAVAATAPSTMTVDATQYTGATAFSTDGSTGLVNITGMTNAQSATMDGGSGGMGAGYAATATSATIGISGGTTAGAVTLTGAKVASVDITASGKTNVVGAIDLAGASTITLDAATKLTATSIDTTSTAATLTISGAGEVIMGTLDDGITTVNASGNSGGVTMTGPADGANTSITLSSGNDTFTTDDDGFTAAQTFAVNAGGGTGDILVVAAAADINTANEAGRYTGFETVRIGDSYDGDTISGVTGLQLTGASSKSYTDLTAAQAGSVQIRGDETSPTFVLKTATGTADSLSLTMGTGTTTAAATDIVTGMTITGFETLNVIENGGATATAGAARTAIIAGMTSTTVTDINLTGRAVTISDVATTKAVDIDGTALTGNGSASGLQGLSVAGSAVAGSVINGSEVNDSMTAGAEGSTYNGNGGTDAFVATAAIILADGTTDIVLNGGAGTDTLTLSDTTVTLTDSHFTNISAMEALTLSNTVGDTVITTGAAFNSAFADDITITSGLIAATKDIAINGGLSTVDMTVTIAATSQTGAATETNSIITGSGADTVTYTDTGWVGAVSGAASGTFAIDTNAGDDTISLTVGTLTNDQTANFITITGGSGQDSITKVGTNDDDGTGVVGMVTFEFAAGDSDTVNYDTITGFDVSTTTLIADELDFEGTAAIGSFTTHNDVGVILSHSTTDGLITFDDAASFATALTINASNLADVVGYLQLNAAANETLSFAFDSTNNGSADGTMVFHQGSAASVADDLVFLAGVTGTDELITTNLGDATAGDIFIA